MAPWLHISQKEPNGTAKAVEKVNWDSHANTGCNWGSQGTFPVGVWYSINENPAPSSHYRRVCQPDSGADAATYTLGTPAINWGDHHWTSTAESLGYPTGPDAADACPTGTVRVTDWDECQALTGSTVHWPLGAPGHDILKQGPNHDPVPGPELLLDFAAGNSREDCQPHFTKSQGCSINPNGAIVLTKPDCNTSLGNINQRPICKKVNCW